MTESLCECFSKVRTEHFHKHFISQVSRNYKSGDHHSYCTFAFALSFKERVKVSTKYLKGRGKELLGFIN